MKKRKRNTSAVVSRKPSTTGAHQAKPAPPRHLTPALCNLLHRDLLAVCQKVARSHGLTAEGGEMADIDLRHGFDIQFRIGIPMPDGSLFSAERELFEVLAGHFGLRPSDYGRTFRSNGELFRLKSINPNRPKYPISAERVADGRGFKFSPDNVIAHLEVADK